MAVQTRHPVKTFTATEALEEFRLVKFTGGSVTAVEYCDVADEPIGVTEYAVSANDNVAVRLLTDTGTFKLTAAGAFTLGDTVGVVADGKVDDDVENAGPQLFYALETPTADGDVVECMILNHKAGAGLRHVTVADGATHTNSTDATDLESYTFDGQAIQPGDVLHIVAQYTTPATNSTDTLTPALILTESDATTTTVFTGAAVDVANDAVGFLEAWIVFRTATTIQSCGLEGLGVEGTVTADPWRTDQQTVAIAGDCSIALNADWSVADAGNTVHCEVFLVEIIRK
jgi:hypothetical protein